MSVLDQLEKEKSSTWEKLNDRGLEGCSLQNLKQLIADNPALKEKLSILAVRPDGTPDVSAWKPDNQFEGSDGYVYKEKFTVKDNKPERYQLIRWKQRSQPAKSVYTTAMVASFTHGQEKQLNEFLEEHLRTAGQRIVDVEIHTVDIVTLKGEIANQVQAEGGTAEDNEKVIDTAVKYLPLDQGQTIIYTAFVKQKVN